MPTYSTYVMNFTDPANGSFAVFPYTTNGPSHPTNGTLHPQAASANTSLLFCGQGLGNYGEIVLENLLHLLENFSGDTPPVFPIRGQLWHDTTSSQLRIWDGTTWVSASNNYLPLDGSVPMMGTLDLGLNDIVNVNDVTSVSVHTDDLFVTNNINVGGLVDGVDVASLDYTVAVHISTPNIHAPLDDTVTSLSGVWSSTKINNELSTKLSDLTNESITSLQDVDNNANINANPGDVLTWDGTQWTATTPSSGGTADGVVTGATFLNNTLTLQRSLGLPDVVISGIAEEIHSHDALDIAFSPTPYIFSTNVQGAIEEVSNTSVKLAGDTMTGTLSMAGNNITDVATPINDDDVATKQYVDRQTSAFRFIVTAPGGTATFTTPDYFVGTNTLQVYSQGVKQYHNSAGYQIVDVNSAITDPSIVSTGLANDDTTYNASVTTDGVNTETIVVKGKFAQTYKDLLDAIDTGFNEPIQNVISGINGVFHITGDYTVLFVAGYVFEVLGSTGNDGTYTTVSSTYDGVNDITEIVVANVPDATIDGVISAGGINFSFVDIFDRNIIFYSTTKGSTSQVSLTDTNLFNSLTTYVGINAAIAGQDYGYYEDTTNAILVNGNLVSNEITFNSTVSAGTVLEFLVFNRPIL